MKLSLPPPAHTRTHHPHSPPPPHTYTHPYRFYKINSKLCSFLKTVLPQSISKSILCKKRASQEKLKTMLMQNFGLSNKEHYGLLWYFLEWSISTLFTSFTALVSFIIAFQEKSHQLNDVLNKVINVIIIIKYLSLVCFSWLRFLAILVWVLKFWGGFFFSPTSNFVSCESSNWNQGSFYFRCAGELT